MDNERIGRFISEMRKDCEMTQKELGDKLNVTDKAVSKWERGLSYPDISLLVPLSDTLGVTINELLSGEKSPDAEAAKPETEATVKNVLQYADETVKSKVKSTRKQVIAGIGLAIFIPMIFVMIGLLFYPAFARRSSANAHQRFIRTYTESVEAMNPTTIHDHFRQAEEFNAALNDISPDEPFAVGYMNLVPDGYSAILNINGIMSWIEIPSLSVSMPISHGTASQILDRGIGHLEGTALPTGGVGNHTVFNVPSGHRFVRLLWDLGELEMGDVFTITTLDRVMTYQIDEKLIINPHEIDVLRAQPDADLVTLMTGYPPHINSHRLLVRGVRVPDI